MVPRDAIPTNRTVFVFDLRLTIQIVQLQGRFNANHDGNRCRRFARYFGLRCHFSYAALTLLVTDKYTHTEGRGPVPLRQVSYYCYKRAHGIAKAIAMRTSCWISISQKYQKNRSERNLRYPEECRVSR